MREQQARGFESEHGDLSIHDGILYIYLYIYIYGCKSNYNVRNKVRDHTRSIPPFHTSVPYLFEGSVTYLWSIRSDIYVYIIILYIYIWIVPSDFTFVRAYMSAHTCMSAYMQEYIYYAQALWLRWQVCACSTYSCYLLCCVMVGMCLAAASWQSRNGLLVTLPPCQPVAGLRLHHLQLLPAAAQLWCLMAEMRLAAASWQSKHCLLRYSGSKRPFLMCCVVVLEWAVSFQTPFHTVPYPLQTWKVLRQLHMVASGWRWLPVVSYLVQDH